MRGSDGNGDTFYYTAISEAQSAVTTYGQTGSQKVIIILGDGDENIAGPDACKKSIANAETAEAAGTWLITIAYNSTDGATSGCVTDYSNTYHGTLAISPECSMHLITADNPVTDNTAFPGFPATAQSYTQITQAEMNDICGTDSTSDTQVTGSRHLQRHERRRPECCVPGDRREPLDGTPRQRLGLITQPVLAGSKVRRRRMSMFRIAKTGLTAVAIACLATAWATASASAAPDPCALVPAATVKAVFGGTATPTFVASATATTATCNYNNGKLTVEIGATALTNLAPALKTTKVKTIPHGVDPTFAHSTQTQIVFYEGSAANGTYIVIRNYVRIPEGKLLKIATVLNKALAGDTNSGSGGGIVSP